jgi:hypothetical protein
VNDYLLRTTCRRRTPRAKSFPPSQLRRGYRSATRNQMQLRRMRRWYRHMMVDQVDLCNGGSGKTRTRHDANGGRHARSASRRGPRSLGASCGTRRKRILRLGERDVKGGEDDWEGEGELDHVCPNRCSDVDIYAIGKGPIYPLQPREVCGNPVRNAITQRAGVRHPSTRLWCCVGASMAFVGVPGIRTWHHSFFGPTVNSHMCPDYSVVEPDRREGTWI